MNYAHLIPGLLFALVGLVAIIFIGRAVISSLIGDFSFVSFLRGRKLQSKTRSLEQARSHFENKEPGRCVRSLQEALFLEPPLINLQFLDAAYDLNFDILSFLLTVNEAISERLHNLPEMEQLLQERMQMHRSLAESYLSLDLIKKKRREEGKKTPDWAVSEFQKKIEGLQEELAANRMEILAVFSKLCDKILVSSPDENQLTYH